MFFMWYWPIFNRYLNKCVYLSISFNYHFNDLFNNFFNWYFNDLFNDFLNWYLHNLFNDFLNYNFNNSFNWHLNNFLHFNNSFELNWSIDRDLHRYFPHNLNSFDFLNNDFFNDFNGHLSDYFFHDYIFNFFNDFDWDLSDYLDNFFSLDRYFHDNLLNFSKFVPIATIIILSIKIVVCSEISNLFLRRRRLPWINWLFHRTNLVGFVICLWILFVLKLILLVLKRFPTFLIVAMAIITNRFQIDFIFNWKFNDF